MSSSAIEQRLGQIDRKLDLLIEQMEVTRRRQRALEEFKDDFTHVASDVFQSATTELEDVAPYFETRDLLHLVKKLLRNTKNLSVLLDRLESLSDLVNDAQPLQKAAFNNLLGLLDEMEQKGYFAFLLEMRGMLDRIVTSFSPEDVRLLSDNVVTILGTVRNFTQPELLAALNNALKLYQHLETDVETDVSYRQLFREARSPEVRRGLLMGMRFLKNISAAESKSSGNGGSDGGGANSPGRLTH